MLFTPKRARRSAAPFRGKTVNPRVGPPNEKRTKQGENMNIMVRGIDPAAVKKIDELAKKQNISRNQFLASLISNYAALEEFKSYQSQYETVIKQCLQVIQQNSHIEERLLRYLESEDNEDTQKSVL
jgi:ribosomal protein S20